MDSVEVAEPLNVSGTFAAPPVGLRNPTCLAVDDRTVGTDVVDLRTFSTDQLPAQSDGDGKLLGPHSQY